MHRVDGVKVTRLTAGDLLHCHVPGSLRSEPMMKQKSAEAVLAVSTHSEGLNKVNRSSTDDSTLR